MQRNWHFRRRFVAVRGPTDVTAPALSLPIDLPLSDTTAYLGVTTNEGAGTLYWVVTTSATPPSAAQVKAGQNDGGTAAAASGNQAVIATGAQVATATGLSSNTAYYGYFMQEDAVGNQSTVSAADGFTTLTTGTSDTSFDNLIAAMSVPPATLRQGYIAQMIQALYAGSAWTPNDLLYVAAAHDEQAARLNWITPGSFTLTAINSPTFTTDRGFNGNGTSSYLDSGWDRATDAVQLTQNSASGGIYTINDTDVGIGVLSNAGGGTGLNFLVNGRASAANARARINTQSLAVTPAASGTVPLHRIGARHASATTVSPYLDGAPGAGMTMASEALTTIDIGMGKHNGNFQGGRWAAAHIGGDLDDSQALALYNALHTYMIAVGADT